MSDLPIPSDPVSNVRWVPLEKVVANNYNPNSVARNEMRLLHLSIEHDGYTQPIVTMKKETYELTLPCGNVSLVNGEDEAPGELWSYLRDQARKSSPIRLVPLKETDVLASIDAKIDTQLESLRAKSITAKSGQDGSKVNGDLDLFKATSAQSVAVAGVIPSCGIGTSPDSMKQSSYLIAFCPICLSNEKKPWKRWSTFVSEPTESTQETGILLKCNLSESIGKSGQTEKSPNISIERSMPLERREYRSAYPDVFVQVKDQSIFVIVDGFHRYLVGKTYKDIFERTGGRVPIVVIDKPINDRMASTVRHNRARGKHSVDGMANMVFTMLENGWEDAAICNELGLEVEELVRLKHITGFSKLFENEEYKKSWETARQIKLRQDYARSHSQNA